MLKYIFLFIVFIHGLIHFMGFAKAFNYGNITQLTKAISRPAGILWLFTALLFLVTVLMVLLKSERWPYLAVFAVLLSQVLICSVWKDAKFGSIANMLILLAAIAAWGNLQFESGFRNDVKENLSLQKITDAGILKEADILALPQPVQKYLRFTGAVNKPAVHNVRIAFSGEMRGKGQGWFAFQSVQYDFIKYPARLFFMKAKMFGVAVPGYHDYKKGAAAMNIKLFGLYPLVSAKGPEMNKSEAVTFFNDICLFAPAMLIDKRIQWDTIDSVSAKAIFDDGTNKIAATLFFNSEGQLINFISDDRYAISEMKQFRFSTPVRDYKIINGRRIPTYGETTWHYPESDFIYGKFNLTSIEYNVNEYAQ